MTSDLNLTGVRFPRSMCATEAHERLLRFLGVRLVDDCDAELEDHASDAELEDHARAWLATAKQGNAESAAAIRKVREALARLDARRAA